MSPLSSDPVKRETQLANLQPGAGAGDGGLRRAHSHGGYAEIVAERLADREREIYDALASDAPLRDSDGGLPRHDSAVVALLAQVMIRLEDVAADIAVRGILEQRGKRRGAVRNVVDLEARLRREAAGYLDALGCTPKSRAALGLNLAATKDLALQWAAEAEAERRASAAELPAGTDGSEPDA
jgi:hypothetical protein